MVRGWRFCSDQSSGDWLEPQKTANFSVNSLVLKVAPSECRYFADRTYTVPQWAVGASANGTYTTCGQQRTGAAVGGRSNTGDVEVPCCRWRSAACVFCNMRHVGRLVVCKRCVFTCNLQLLSLIRMSASRGPGLKPRPRHGRLLSHSSDWCHSIIWN